MALQKILSAAFCLKLLLVIAHAANTTCDEETGRCAETSEGNLLVQRITDVGIAVEDEWTHEWKHQRSMVGVSKNVLRVQANASLLVEAALSAGLKFTVREAEELVLRAQHEHANKDLSRTTVTMSMSSAASALLAASKNETSKKSLQTAGFKMAETFLTALVVEKEITTETVWAAADIGVAACLGILSATNPLLGMFATIGWSFFKSLFEPDPPPPSPEELLFAQIVEAVGQMMSKDKAQEHVKAIAAEAAAITDELNFMGKMIQDTPSTNFLYQLMIQHDVAKASFKLKTYEPPEGQENMWAYFIAQSAQLLEGMQVSAFSQLVFLDNSFKDAIHERCKALIAGPEATSWQTFFTRIKTQGKAYVNTDTLGWNYVKLEGWNWGGYHCDVTAHGSCDYMEENQCAKKGCQVFALKRIDHKCSGEGALPNGCTTPMKNDIVAEKESIFDNLMAHHDGIYAAVQWKWVSVSDKIVCNESNRIAASCGDCGPHWGDRAQCQNMCSQTSGCQYYTFFSDNGCRLYSQCYSMWLHPWGGVASSIWGKVPEYNSLVSVGFLECDESKRLPASCGHCGPHWGDRAQCQNMCSQTSGCTYYTFFSDNGCRLYSQCDSITWYNSSSVTSTIWAKV